MTPEKVDREDQGFGRPSTEAAFPKITQAIWPQRDNRHAGSVQAVNPDFSLAHLLLRLESPGLDSSLCVRPFAVLQSPLVQYLLNPRSKTQQLYATMYLHSTYVLPTIRVSWHPLQTTCQPGPPTPFFRPRSQRGPPVRPYPDTTNCLSPDSTALSIGRLPGERTQECGVSIQYDSPTARQEQGSTASHRPLPSLNRRPLISDSTPRAEMGFDVLCAQGLNRVRP